MNILRRLLGRGSLNRELADEIRGHLEERVEELAAQGMAADEARRTARREFGNALAIEERGREVWRWGAVEDFFADLRFAARQLRRDPPFGAAAVALLALGIGANTAVFSVVDAVILRPLPFPEPDRLVSLQMRDVRGVPHSDGLDYPTFFDLRERNRAFESVVSYRPDQFVLTGRGNAVQLHGAIVSWDLFALLGVQPFLGRGFVAEEEQAGQRAVVLSYALWTTRFGADPDLIGRPVTIDREPYTVVGIAAKGFQFPVAARPLDLWVTLARDSSPVTLQPATRQRGARMLSAIARLKPGISVAQARTDADRVAAALAEEYPNSNRNIPGTFVIPELEHLVGSAREPMLILFGAVGLVLLITCANIANLLLVRNAERQREFALRAAIGAGRGRMVRQAIAESLALAMVGCSAGVVGAWALLGLIRHLAAAGVPRIQTAGLDARVLGYSISLAIATSILFGLPPALRLIRADLGGTLKEGSRTSAGGGSRLRAVLAAAQVAVGLVLLSGASVLVAGFLRLTDRNLGFQPDRLLTFSLSLPGAEYSKTRQVAFHDRMLELLRAVPGAESAALAMPLPFTGPQMTVSFNIDGRPSAPSQRPRASMAIVTPEYFRTIGAPLEAGRDFSGRDDVDAQQVAIVNRAFARKFFPGEEALGKRIESGASGPKGGTQMREIVGIVGNVMQSPLIREAEAIYYLPYRQLQWCCPSVLLRSAAPASIAPAIRNVVAQLDSQLAVDEVRTGADLASAGVAVPRFQMMLLGSLAAIALFVAVIGLYGVVAYSVTRRTREMGVRIALGASPGALKRMVLAEAARVVGAGSLVGLAGAFAAGRVLSGMAYELRPGDPLLIAVACAALAAAAAMAAYIPARRASRIDPIAALGSE